MLVIKRTEVRPQAGTCHRSESMLSLRQLSISVAREDVLSVCRFTQICNACRLTGRGPKPCAGACSQGTLCQSNVCVATRLPHQFSWIVPSFGRTRAKKARSVDKIVPESSAAEVTKLYRDHHLVANFLAMYSEKRSQ